MLYKFSIDITLKDKGFNGDPYFVRHWCGAGYRRRLGTKGQVI